MGASRSGRQGSEGLPPSGKTQNCSTASDVVLALLNPARKNAQPVPGAAPRQSAATSS